MIEQIPMTELTHLSYTSGNHEFLRLLSTLHRESFEDIDQRGWSETEMTETLQSPGMQAQIFSHKSQPVGFVLYRTVAGEAEIIGIGTRPNWQGRGIARQMLNQIIRQLSQNRIEQVFLEVREDNMKAIQLYTALNFTLNGRRNKYYQTMSGKNIDALVFCLRL